MNNVLMLQNIEVKNKGSFPDFVYPRSGKNNRRVPDRSQLSLNIPEVKVYLADPTHRKKTACTNLYKHANALKKQLTLKASQ